MKKSIQIIATVLVILFGNSAVGQNDTIYVIQDGVVLWKHATSSLDSIIFYDPNPIDTTTNSTITDADGNVYTSVTIGSQEWMVENLRTTKYSDGTAIPNVIGNSQWSDLETAAWCYYDNDSQYDRIYGKLYNWFAVETGKLCPTGWHVPTDAEWTDLTNYLTANGHPGEVLKSTSGWNDYNGQSGNGTDIYGWNGLPGGSRFNHGIFFDNGDFGYWFSSTDFNTQYAWFHLLEYSYNDIYSDYWNKNYGFSVRCLKD